jgi:hypothetical protein
MGLAREELRITLTSRNSTIFTFAWNATGYARGNYTFGATADIVPGETTTADNTNFGRIIVTRAGDLGGSLPPQFFKSDFKVNGKDLSLFLQCYKGTAPPETEYLADLGGGNPPQFFNCDGKIDGKDLALFLICYKELGPSA